MAENWILFCDDIDIIMERLRRNRKTNNFFYYKSYFTKLSYDIILRRVFLTGLNNLRDYHEI